MKKLLLGRRTRPFRELFDNILIQQYKVLRNEMGTVQFVISLEWTSLKCEGISLKQCVMSREKNEVQQLSHGMNL
jgi:hypothetical protein